MTTAALVQGSVIGVVVAWSAAYAALRLAPVSSRRALTRLLRAVDRPGLPRGLHARLERLAPHATTGASCGDGCASCGGCGAPAASLEAEPIRLTFREPSRH